MDEGKYVMLLLYSLAVTIAGTITAYNYYEYRTTVEMAEHGYVQEALPGTQNRIWVKK